MSIAIKIYLQMRYVYQSWESISDFLRKKGWTEQIRINLSNMSHSSNLGLVKVNIIKMSPLW